MSITDDLFDAAQYQDLRGIKAALKAGADIHARRNGKDILYYASLKIHMGRVNECGTLLLKEGAELQGRCKACLLGVGTHDPNAREW